MVKQLPGFFFDPEKGKYFPLHMKAAYDKELQKQKNNKLREESDRILPLNSSGSLYKFLPVGNGNRLFDSIPEKLNRTKIKEIIWRDEIDIHPDAEIYYRYSWINNRINVESVCPETNLSVNTFEREFSAPRPIENFKVLRRSHENENYYCFVVNINEYNSFHFYCFDSVSDNSDKAEITMLPFDFNLQIHSDPSICYLTLDGIRILRLKNNNMVASTIYTQIKDIVAIKYIDNFGTIISRRGGTLNVLDNLNESINLAKKLIVDSTAKWIEYIEAYKKLVLLTYHGHVLIIDLQKDLHQTVLFEITNLPIHKDSFRFEDFQIHLVGKLLFMGYRGGTEILASNAVDGGRIVKAYHLPKPFEQFSVSSDFSRLYIRTK
jgi:hypothetical protein